MRKLLLITILFLAGTSLLAQDEEKMIEARPVNSVGVTLLGDASIISFSYEKQHFDSKTMFASKIGLGYNEEFEICFLGSCSTPKKYLIIPHHFTANFGKKKHFFEVGLGGAIVLGKTTQPYILYPIVGYRFLPLKANNVNLRFFVQVPFTGIDTDNILFVPFGLNVGISL